MFPFYQEIVTEVPLTVYETLQAHFGGDPITFPLARCRACAGVYERLQQRREDEYQSVRDCESSYDSLSSDWYIISKSWASQWQEFVAQADSMTPPPGPIDNRPLFDDSGELRSGLHPKIDYLAVRHSVWLYLHGQYGGGPAVNRPHKNVYRLLSHSPFETASTVPQESALPTSPVTPGSVSGPEAKRQKCVGVADV